MIDCLYKGSKTNVPVYLMQLEGHETLINRLPKKLTKLCENKVDNNC